ncbi:MAG: HAMP domain-containing protein [Desulfobacula sp.]|jgi:signal transduction histidine kinase|nr:HAMP domain-containing protein [Desulfobacula sp.]
MKIKSLYVKLLLSFFGVLFITEILILGLFVATAGRSFKHYIDKQSIAKLLLFKEVVQEKINNDPSISLEQNYEIKKLLFTFADLFNVKIWVSAPDTSIIIKTFLTPVDIKRKNPETHDVLKDGIKLYHLSGRGPSYYAQIPIKMGADSYTFHIRFFKGHERKPEAAFLFGLLFIGLIIAILIVPLARIITHRINQLNKAALEFADGNLNCRTDIKGRDEIAGLANSFNFMADKLEKIIKGNKAFTANISHELRSPLTRIRVSKELIQDRLDSDVLDTIKGNDIKRYVQNIDQDIDTLDRLIDKILKLSKMDIQQISMTIEPLDFETLLTRIERKYEPLLKQKNLILKKDINPSLMFNMDKNMVSSILTNLFDNAVKYTGQKGVIRLAALKTEKNILIFKITNTYRELDAQELKKLFEPFQRIDTNENPGSGLGLTIVKKQLARCNGNISAKNSSTGLEIEVHFLDQRLP